MRGGRNFFYLYLNNLKENKKWEHSTSFPPGIYFEYVFVLVINQLCLFIAGYKMRFCIGCNFTPSQTPLLFKISLMRGAREIIVKDYLWQSKKDLFEFELPTLAGSDFSMRVECGSFEVIGSPIPIHINPSSVSLRESFVEEEEATWLLCLKDEFGNACDGLSVAYVQVGGCLKEGSVS